MNPERWQQIERLYNQALEREPDERSAFLDEVCRGDENLRPLIESLLAREPDAENLSETARATTVAGSHLRRGPALVRGQTFGSYRILRLLGSGGMGEVYKARDTRLKRAVAIKVLLQNISEGSDLRERFQRESKVIAKLNHPNICMLHDVGQEDGLDYLVMEYVEGETLAHRLKRGTLPLPHVIKVALEITDALDKVHREGMIHRDLKPRNIMLTRSGAKLLDFGLAKLARNPAAELPTVTKPDINAEGPALGTLQYMAPEQIQGEEADSRSDIFSLGVIIYEMLTGHQFQDPKSRLLEYVIRRCIAKNPDDRWQNAHDLLLQFHWIAQKDAASTAEPARSATSGRAALLIGIVAIILAILLVLVRHDRDPAVAYTQFPIYPPPNQPLLSPGTVSPDGRTVAFMTYDGRGDKIIWLRSLESMDVKPLRGTEEILPPFFWSPDGKQIGFFTPGHLKKIALPEVPPQTLADVRPFDSGASGGGAWGADGTILFSPGADQPLFRIPAAGGAPSPATILDETREEVAHVWPYFLPDGKHFIYVARSRNPEKTGLYAGLLGSSDRKRILDGNTMASYAAPGYLLFVREQKLLAQKFDTSRLELSGAPTVLASGLEAIGWYSVSQNGVLTLESNPNPPKLQLIWFGRKGEQIALLGPPDTVSTPAVSPDGREVAVDHRVPGMEQNIWLLDAESGHFVPFTLEGLYDQAPVWSRDGKFMAFATESPTQGWIIRRKRTVGPGETEHLATLMGESYTADWSPDGKYIAYETYDQETRWDCWLLPLMGDHKPRALLKTSFNERQVQFSPDGHWIAYTSDLSGRDEVYVQRFPLSGEKWNQISSDGGGQPRWRRDGRELFYVAANRKLMAVEMKTSPRFAAGPPIELFQLRLQMSDGLNGTRHYDVSADGQRFLVNTVVGAPSALITVILNWTAALKRQ